MKYLASLGVLVILFSCFSCKKNEDDAVVVEEGPNATITEYLFIVAISRECFSYQYYGNSNVDIHLYSIDDFFDYSNKVFYRTVKPNDQNLHYTPPLDDGKYYYEVEDLNDGSMLMSGVFNFSGRIKYYNNQILLRKVKKRGAVYEVDEEGMGTGERVISAQLKFTHEITGEEYFFNSYRDGEICIELDYGRYYVHVTHEEYEDYQPEEVYLFTYGGVNGINFFLKKL